MAGKVVQAPIIWENQKFCVKPDCAGNLELFYKAKAGEELIAVMSKDKRAAGIVGGENPETTEFVTSMADPPKEIKALVESLKILMDD